MPCRYDALPLSAQTAYAQLQDVGTALELERSIAHLHGSFSRKTVRGKAYWYFSFRDLDGKVRQLYAGPDNETVRSAVASARASGARPDTVLAPLARSAVALGCASLLPRHLRAVRRLAEYGFFRAGGVLVGTHAFVAIANMLGLRWKEGVTTTDIDFAHAGRNVSIALPADVKVDVHAALSSFEQGFIPMIHLEGDAGASYRLRGDAEFQIDFLTARGRGGETPRRLANLNVALQPLRFMEFSLESVAQAVLMDRNGACVLATLPSPARYAIHKLLVAGERGASYRTKANKDIQQAAALFEALSDSQPDSLREAWEDAVARGPGWRRRAQQGLAALRREQPDAGIVAELAA